MLACVLSIDVSRYTIADIYYLNLKHCRCYAEMWKGLDRNVTEFDKTPEISLEHH